MSSTTSDPIPPAILQALNLAHASWQPVLKQGLEAVAAADPSYLQNLAVDQYLPTQGRMFAAFAEPLTEIRYVLVGEGPYPREQSATGVCFMDGAVGTLWSEKGLSKPVNRATSLRNFMKMLLVAEGLLSRQEEDKAGAMAKIAHTAQATGSPFIQTLFDLQTNLIAQGFLLLNATLVYRPHVPPIKEAKAWQPFLHTVLNALAEVKTDRPMLVLWGKIAEKLNQLPVTDAFPKIMAEHPYNLSFIDNVAMQKLFGPMHLLRLPT